MNLGTVVNLSSVSAGARVGRNHKLAHVRRNLSLWAIINEMQLFAYVRFKDAATPEAVSQALEESRAKVIASLAGLTTKPLQPNRSPYALVNKTGSRCSTKSLVRALQLAKEEVYDLQGS